MIKVLCQWLTVKSEFNILDVLFLYHIKASLLTYVMEAARSLDSCHFFVHDSAGIYFHYSLNSKAQVWIL